MQIVRAYFSATRLNSAELGHARLVKSSSISRWHLLSIFRVPLFQEIQKETVLGTLAALRICSVDFSP